ncbi:MAG: YggS family pyridoxal phosphate-dependent enzyme [Clostridia bacterium]|nr:YggS family pyridoxal phosphate-dependent enzyme [Clostridia bacterium]
MTDIHGFLNRVGNALSLSGRGIENLDIVCATKTRTVEELSDFSQGYKKAYADVFGKEAALIFGENREQELIEKYGKLDVHWQFIGQLQSNKVKYIYDKVELIHSVDRLNLAKEIDKYGKKGGRAIPVLIEVNIGREAQKGGLLEEDLDGFLAQTAELAGVLPCGLMSVMPVGEKSDRLYCKMKELFDKYKGENSNWKYLSMGMSDDFEVAIKCGSNMIRCGRVLLGDRIYPKIN